MYKKIKTKMIQNFLKKLQKLNGQCDQYFLKRFF